MSKAFQTGDYVAVHENPLWRDKSDFIVQIYLGENEGRSEWEQLWVRRINEHQFALCCIPFFAYNLALGDVVETDAKYVVQRTVEQSGQFTFRIWFGDSTYPGIKDEVLQQLEVFGVPIEWSSANLLAISAKDAVQAQQVEDYLYIRQKASELVYEPGQV